MFGAIIGDLAGSIYEYSQIKKVKPIKMNNIIEDNAFFSDDSILTIAVLDAIINDKNYEITIKNYIKKYISYKPEFLPYFKTTFSPKIINWSQGIADGDSIGNGAMMRISPVGYLFNDEHEIILNAKLVTETSHNSKEAIEKATKVALVIYYLRKKIKLNDIYRELDIKLKYNQFEKFNTTCNETFDNCMYILYNSNSFEDAIKKAVMMGGDTDTNACIVGSMAEALYGVSDELIIKAKSKLPKEFIKVLEKGYSQLTK